MSRMRWFYPRTPALGRDLPRNYREGRAEFDKRVKAKFPKGVGEAHLIEELRKQGFSIDGVNPLVAALSPGSIDIKSATLMRGIVCKTLWSVRWRTQADRVEEVWGVYGVVAP